MLALFDKFRKGHFAHGVHPHYHKETTQGKAIKRLPFAPRLIVPVSQHIGAPAKPVVKVGEEVLRGQMIAEANGFMSVPVHAPATGVVSDIGLMPSAAGPKTLSIVIDVYKGDSQQVRYGDPVILEKLSRDELLQRVQATGMVGSGRGGFPLARQTERSRRQNRAHAGDQRLRMRALPHLRPSGDAGRPGSLAARHPLRPAAFWAQAKPLSALKTTKPMLPPRSKPSSNPTTRSRWNWWKPSTPKVRKRCC